MGRLAGKFVKRDDLKGKSGMTYQIEGC